ncbi:enoyl-CoA hydratase-related protein [Methylosinus sp. Sm6]|uniref:enoyl-CoA hydratase-related protein n=1 Tax=Methylosinus sp. Sm6 TaxID=2866948 RepID=UPI001C990980|nr:enoyl-CoA hydratase-related protein [Methylosinus sp. Sm6]MBY6241779.1 enoyl-CoA hydratase/isomerase family protein [Methylosinus sp. Sm6]
MSILLESSTLLESIDARGVARVTFNRPERRNALDPALVAETIGALRRLEAREDVRVVLLAGAGGSFCAGGDIESMKRMAAESFEENERDALLLSELMQTLDRLAKPTLALVRGAVYGGGVGLVSCCDIVVAADTASFCLSEVKIGLTPSVIGPYVHRAIGPRQARRYFLTAEVITAIRAREIGLAHEVAQEQELDAVCARIVDALLAAAPGALREAKESCFLFAQRVLDEELSRETAQRIAGRRISQEGREGFTAFLEKRPPAWRTDTKGRDVP